MKPQPSQKIKIGVFTLAGICLLLLGLFIIGSRKNMFGNTFMIYGLYKNVGGLQKGNNIRFAGIDVGTVEDISIVNDSTVRVDMRLQSRVHPFLKKDALASIGSDGLMGDKLVTISAGTEGESGLISKGGQVRTIDPNSFDKIVSRFGHVVDNAEIITASLADISSHISSGKGSIGKLIYSDSVERGLVNTMQSARQGAQGFSDNMKAMKHNFLLKGYYKNKTKDSVKAAKKAERQERRQERKDRRNGGSTTDNTGNK